MGPAVSHGMNGIFDELVPWIPSALVSPGVVERIRALNDRLPAGLSTVGGLECLLTGAGGRDPFAGWILGVSAAHGGREALAGTPPSGGVPPAFLADERWRRLRDFVTAWADPSSPLHAAVADIWLEFDPDVLSLPVPVPGVFVHSEPDSSGGAPGTPRMAASRRVLERVLPLVQERPLSAAALGALDRCFGELPAAGGTPFVAFMMSRKKSGVRLMLSMPIAEVRGYLGRIGWNGDPDEACALVEDLGPRVDELFLHLDVGEAVHPRVGVECHLRRKQPRIEPRWASFMGHLVAMGLCTGLSRDAVLSWPGHARGVLPGEVLPSYVFRGISHVKIVSRLGEPPVSKVYLGFRRLDEDLEPGRGGSPGPGAAPGPGSGLGPGLGTGGDA